MQDAVPHEKGAMIVMARQGFPEGEKTRADGQTRTLMMPQVHKWQPVSWLREVPPGADWPGRHGANALS